MKNNKHIWIGAAVSLGLSLAALWLALTMTDSIMAYRSPLRDNPPQPGPALSEPATRRVVFVLVDALRADTAAEAAIMPTLADLRSQGAWATMHSQPPSYSDPGWATLLTGAWPELGDSPVFNADYDSTWTYTQDNLFSAAQRAGLKTAVSGYYWFEKLLPQDTVQASFYTPGEDETADRQVVDAALPWLDDPSYALVLIHLDQVDYAGHHLGGPQNCEWVSAAERVDGLIAEIAAKLDFSQDTLLVVSDHGQIDPGGHGGHDPVTLLEPFILTGAGVKPGQYADIQMADVAPTVAALLGLNLPASVQGQPLTPMLALSDEVLERVPAALQNQQTALAIAYAQSIGLESPAGTIAEMRAARLRGGQILRFAAAGLVLLAAGFLLARRLKGSPAWLLGVAAILYLLVFHLRYAVLDGHTYSYSSLASPTWLLVYCGSTAGLAFILAALLVFAAGRLRKAPAGTLPAQMINLGLVVQFLLALPFLFSFGRNGLLSTWHLPELASHYLALLCLVQILFTGITSLLLTGLSGFVFTLRSKTDAGRAETA